MTRTKKKKYTQLDAVMDYMKEHGSITSIDAIYHLHITRLSSRITDLEDMGVKIKRETEDVYSRWGKTSIVRYSLE